MSSSRYQNFWNNYAKFFEISDNFESCKAEDILLEEEHQTVSFPTIWEMIEDMFNDINVPKLQPSIDLINPVLNEPIWLPIKYQWGDVNEHENLPC